jgi:hypothetical protein
MVMPNVVVTASGCWEGPHKHRTPKGYSRSSMRGVAYFWHRATYTALVGPIPDKYVIDHKCRNRACCNPNHLRAVTKSINGKENVKGRNPRVLDGVCAFCSEPVSEVVWMRHGRPQTYKVCLPCSRAGRNARRNRKAS